MNVNTKALLPCPFCGGTEINEAGNGTGDNWLECSQCGAGTSLSEDGVGMVARWNRRVNQEADRLAALEAENGRLKRDVDGLVELTMELDEHPDGYDGPCMCKLCQSYLDVDEEALAVGGDQ